MNNPTSRTVPHDIGAERAILGAALLNDDTVGMALERGLVAADFYREPHAETWRHMTALVHKSQPVDMVTLSGALETVGKLDAIGGLSYLAGLPASTPSVANVGKYIDAVKAKSRLRGLLVGMAEVTEGIYSGALDDAGAIAAAEGLVFTAGGDEASKGLRRASESSERVWAALMARAENPSDVHGLSTGFPDLDRVIGGLSPTDLIVLAGRPAMGKTAFALNIAEHVAMGQGANVAVFSMEMGEEQLIGRLACALARVDGYRFKSGRLRADDWPMLTEAFEAIHAAPIFIDDKAGQTIASIRSGAMKLKRSKGLDLVIVDYLQLARGTGKEQSREQEIAHLSRELKCLAKDLDIPVIALSQLNRGVESRADKRPLMSDLRESGAIEQDADIIAFMYRDEVYNENSEMKGIAECIVRKNRHGGLDNVKLRWSGEHTRFSSLARETFG